MPEIKDITESVYTSITVQPDSLYRVHASVAGILDRNLVEEGDEIEAGTALHELVNTSSALLSENSRLAMDLALKEYEGTTGQLAALRDEIESAELRMKDDSINYMRQKNLWEQQIGSRSEYDTRKLRYELSMNALSVARNKYYQTENLLLTQWEQAKNSFNNASVTTEDFTVESTMAGKVYAVYKNPGEIVTTRDPLALIGSASVFVIEMLVDEVDIVKIRKDQEVLATLDAYGEQIFKARIHKIYPNKDIRNQTFLVEALFESPPEVLYPGLAGEANIIISHKVNAMVIPKSYLLNGKRVMTDDGEVEVQTGLQTLDAIEILSGITDETWIYKRNND